jgi:hypothetical protein
MTWRIVFLCAFAGVAVAAEIARPGATAADWLANAEAAAKAAGATAKTLDGIGAVAWGAIGVAALGALRILAPLIPGGGPLVKMAADAAWAMMAHKDQGEPCGCTCRARARRAPQPPARRPASRHPPAPRQPCHRAGAALLGG